MAQEIGRKALCPPGPIVVWLEIAHHRVKRNLNGVNFSATPYYSCLTDFCKVGTPLLLTMGFFSLLGLVSRIHLLCV